MSDDINLETVKNTQKLLGKYVKKPVLTEKLLRKPPFRFLHDVITCVIRDTGFLKGLYTEDELQSDNVKEKEAKLNFLTKLIDAMKSITGKEIKARPGKIIAGLEPKETNHLLQLIAKALDKKVDSSVYINKLKKETRSETNVANKKEKKRTPSTARDSSSDKKTTKTSSKNSTPRKNDDNASGDRTRKSKVKNESITNSKSIKHSRSKEKEIGKEVQKIGTDSKESEEKAEKQSSNETIKEEEHAERLETVQEVQDKDDTDKVEPTEENNDVGKSKEEIVTTTNSKENLKVKERKLKDDEIKDSVDALLLKKDTTLIRPKSAKPKSSGLGRDREKQIVSNIPPENTAESNLNDPTHVQRPTTSLLRPPSVRPSSARPGAPRLKQETVIPTEEVVPMGKVKVIVDNFDKNDVDDEETVTIQMAEPPSDISVHPPALPPDARGHLVEQILEQLQIDDDDKSNATTQVEIEWEQEEGLGGKDAANKEIEQVRTTLQHLTKSANPLGKMLGYLHEDIDAMHAELNMWWESRKQAEKEIAEQKRAIEEEQKPLLIQLETVRGNIEKYKKQIAAAEANILQNEKRIQNLLLLN